MTPIKGLVVAALISAACSLAEASVYKYRETDDSTLYSDMPDPDGTLVRRLKEEWPPSSQSAAGRGLSLADSSPEGLAESQMDALDAADEEIRAADRALREAQERQRKAVEPLPGERVGNVGGHSRLRPEYFARQRAEADEVEVARTRLEAAYRARNEQRE